MNRLTVNSQSLLVHQIKSRGSFLVVLQQPNGERVRAKLETQHDGQRINLTLRACGTVNSTTLPLVQADKTLKYRAQRWIEDCANGRLERAA
ncbi:hypothetical protein [Halopseudomonas sp.]|uniref:hypothetical protein n=1 Tax=Halopseudomonas sp. TaxID=2901191 RepID=UPI00311D51C9